MEYPVKVRAYTLIVLLVAVLLCPAQDGSPSPNPKTGDFFSGIVVFFSGTALTVDRKGLGKDSAVTKTFVIDDKTKIEGSLKAKAHVTVRFMPGENAARAVHIIVR